MDGKSEILSDALAVGLIEGDNVGPAESIAEGSCDGSRVVGLDGSPIYSGPEEGLCRFDGTSLGLVVSFTEGRLVGTSDGIEEDEVKDWLVGLEESTPDGKLEGRPVSVDGDVDGLPVGSNEGCPLG